MKTRYYISEIYCCGYLGTGYSVATKEQAMECLADAQELNEPNASITIVKQTKKWYQRFWRTEEIVAEWVNE